MNSLLVRSSSSLIRSALKSHASLRTLTTYSTRILANSKLTHNEKTQIHKKYSLASQLNISRFYSSEKFTPSQIEEKVLEIIKNFDRVKENPAKPQVKKRKQFITEFFLLKYSK